MKIKNITDKVIHRKHDGAIISVLPDEVVEVEGHFNLSSGLEEFKGVLKPSKSKPSKESKKDKRSLKDKVIDLLDDGKLNHSNKKSK